MNYLIIFFLITGLISKNFLYIIFVLLINLFLLKLYGIELKIFWKNLGKLSPFCIMLIISYFFVGILRNAENIIYIYLKNSAVIVFKIMLILLTNLIFQRKFLDNESNFLKKYFLLFSTIEKILFDILKSYPGKIEKVKNIHNIIVEFILNSINRSQHGISK